MVDVERRKKTAHKQAVHYRNYRRARERALTKLSQAYPDEYKALLELEKLRDVQTGTKWVDITGATLSDVVVSAVLSGETGDLSEILDEYEDEGYNGGEA